MVAEYKNNVKLRRKTIKYSNMENKNEIKRKYWYKNLYNHTSGNWKRHTISSIIVTYIRVLYTYFYFVHCKYVCLLNQIINSYINIYLFYMKVYLNI